MKPFPFILLATLSMLLSCNDSDRSTNSAPENDINTATEFLRSALDGNYDKARTLMVDDSINRQDMDVSERLYKERMSPAEKNQYRGASILIHEKNRVNDSTTIVYYSNSYRNQKDSLKLVKMDGRWLVDFKYIFKHKPDSLP